MTDDNTTGDSEQAAPLGELTTHSTADLGTTLTVREVAARLGKSAKTVRRMVLAGSFSDAHQAPIPNGGGQTQWVVPYASVLAWERDQADKATRVAPAARPQPDEREQELERLRQENNDLRRDLAVAQTQASERARTADDLRAALDLLNRALPAAGGEQQTRRRRWRRSNPGG